MRGYTLIELIIYVAVLGLIAASFGSLAVSISGAAGRASGSADLEESIRMTLEAMHDAFASATSIQYPASGASDTYLEVVNAETSVIHSFGISSGVFYQGISGTASSAISAPDVVMENLTFTNRTVVGQTRGHVGISFTARSGGADSPSLTLPITTSFITGQ